MLGKNFSFNLGNLNSSVFIPKRVEVYQSDYGLIFCMYFYKATSKVEKRDLQG